ncbi:MAG TPA: hypothetical protein VGQ86_09535 [Candidatus Limnocylindria bacterium]|nr:hypothetical protein [Candidatus Limnocylindria bacterium]
MRPIDYEILRENEPDLDRLVRERDPLPVDLDERFYTGLGALSSAALAALLERERLGQR